MDTGEMGRSTVSANTSQHSEQHFLQLNDRRAQAVGMSETAVVTKM